MKTQIYTFINVRYADYDPSKVISLQLVSFTDSGREEYETYIRPYNGLIIDKGYLGTLGFDIIKVLAAPSFPDIYKKIEPYLNGAKIFYHNSSNILALKSICHNYGLGVPEAKWINTETIVRRTWEEFHHGGFGLLQMRSFLNIDPSANFATTTAAIVVKASQKWGTDIDDMIDLAEMSSDRYYTKLHGHCRPSNKADLSACEGNLDGPFYGHTIVFTGKLDRQRSELRELAVKLGFNFADTVNKNTTMLVVGTYDNPTVMTVGKSSKQLKAEKMNAEGKAEIQIMSSDTFYKMIEDANK
ncbi:MAG: BRCT domain-containing protein [Candidatus Cryptobacteroides sp.]